MIGQEYEILLVFDPWWQDSCLQQDNVVHARTFSSTLIEAENADLTWKSIICDLEINYLWSSKLGSSKFCHS